MNTVSQDRHPNFRVGLRFFLVRCFACDPEYGRENYAPVVATGICAWCGWGGEELKQPSTTELRK